MRIFCPAMVASVSFFSCRCWSAAERLCRALRPLCPTPAVGRVACPSQAPPRKNLSRDLPAGGRPYRVGWLRARPPSRMSAMRGAPTRKALPRNATCSLCRTDTAQRNRGHVGAPEGCISPPGAPLCLLDDLRNPTRADRTATLADREPEAFLHGDRLDQLHRHRGVVAGHDHLRALGQGDHAGDVGGAEVELRAVVLEERGVPAALLLGEDVHG